MREQKGYNGLHMGEAENLVNSSVSRCPEDKGDQATREEGGEFLSYEPGKSTKRAEQGYERGRKAVANLYMFPTPAESLQNLSSR